MHCGHWQYIDSAFGSVGGGAGVCRLGALVGTAGALGGAGGSPALGAVVEGFEDVEDDADAPSDASSWVRERSGSPCDAPSRLRRCSGSECRLLCLALPGLGLDAFVLRRREEDLLPIALRQLVYVNQPTSMILSNQQFT